MADARFRARLQDLLADADIQLDGPRPWDLQIHDRDFPARVLAGGSLALGESYMDGAWDVASLDGLLYRLLRAGTDRRVHGFAELRLAVLARFGVGYDNVDVEACTRNGVLLTITPDGVRRPVAVAALTFILALSHRLLQKDRLTRAGRWAEKLDWMGMGVTGRTLGLVGLGNIGREICRLARPFDLCLLASGHLDAYVEEGVNLWDHAAAGLVARAAGARWSLHTGASGRDLLVCAPEPAYEEFLAAVLEAGFARSATGE